MRVICNKCCQARSGNFCMWKVDDRLIKLANDKNYKMCERLRTKILNLNYKEIKNDK